MLRLLSRRVDPGKEATPSGVRSSLASRLRPALGLMLLVSLVGCSLLSGGPPAPQPESAAPITAALADWPIYAPPSGKFTLRYPPGWRVVEQDDHTQLLPPGRAFVDLFARDLKPTPRQDGSGPSVISVQAPTVETVQEALDSYATRLRDFAVIQPPTADPNVGIVARYRWTDDAGVPFETRLVVLVREPLLFIVYEHADPGQAVEVQAMMDAIRGSLQVNR